MSSPPDNTLPDPDQTMADLLRELAARAAERDEARTERDEALARETAIAEVLQAIDSSPGDLAPVFKAILEKAHALCEASFGGLMIYDGERFRSVAQQGVPEAFQEFIGKGILPAFGDPFSAMVAGAPLSHIHDLAAVAAEHPGNPLGAPLSIWAGSARSSSCRCAETMPCLASSPPTARRCARSAANRSRV